MFTPGTWPIAADVKIPAHVALKMDQGAVFAIADGKTLTIQGPFEARLFPVFSVSGSAKVIFAAGAVTQVYPEWWGAKTDGKDSRAAFQAAINTGLKVVATGTYTVDNSTSALKFSLVDTLQGHLEGAHGWNQSRLNFTSPAHPGIQINYASSGTSSVIIKSLLLVGPGGTTAGNYGIDLPGGVGTAIGKLTIDDVRVQDFGDDGIRLRGPTGPIQIRDTYIYNCNGYGIKIAADPSGAATQDVTINGGAIQGTCLGGIAADGTGASIPSLNVIDCDIELVSNTRPGIYLNNVYGATFLNTTVAALGTLHIGDGVIYSTGVCIGNSFIGMLTRGAKGAHNFSFSGTGGKNIVQGGFHYTDDHVNSYFAKVSGEIGDSFLNPALSPGTYAANHALVYETAPFGNSSLCIGISKLVQTAIYTTPQPIMSTSMDWLPNGGATIPAGTAIAKSFAVPGLLATDLVQVSMGTCPGGTAKWFIQAAPEGTDTVTVSLLNGSGADRAFGTSAIPIHLTIYRK